MLSNSGGTLDEKVVQERDSTETPRALIDRFDLRKHITFFSTFAGFARTPNQDFDSNVGFGIHLCVDWKLCANPCLVVRTVQGSDEFCRKLCPVRRRHNDYILGGHVRSGLTVWAIGSNWSWGIPVIQGLESWCRPRNARSSMDSLSTPSQKPFEISLPTSAGGWVIPFLIIFFHSCLDICVPWRYYISRFG